MNPLVTLLVKFSAKFSPSPKSPSNNAPCSTLPTSVPPHPSSKTTPGTTHPSWPPAAGADQSLIPTSRTLSSPSDAAPCDSFGLTSLMTNTVHVVDSPPSSPSTAGVAPSSSPTSVPKSSSPSHRDTYSPPSPTSHTSASTLLELWNNPGTQNSVSPHESASSARHYHKWSTSSADYVATTSMRLPTSKVIQTIVASPCFRSVLTQLAESSSRSGLVVTTIGLRLKNSSSGSIFLRITPTHPAQKPSTTDSTNPSS